MFFIKDIKKFFFGLCNLDLHELKVMCYLRYLMLYSNKKILLNNISKLLCKNPEMIKNVFFMSVEKK